ncbi:uncharacterized protein B4U80_14413 [Leptotrombidium deliense]|uniref:Uncharacterized protein n=1 Tax=Leptotrombidium deliense TaxID=299467 RepID=A0A443RWJ5_9ACAR|nr:uncharacterized protein B4U80_14413 [Leptotrombidium deliense]
MEVEKTCRICFTQENQEEMIAPCGCKGSIEYIHIDCLKRWVTTSGKIQCDLCTVLTRTVPCAHNET